ncbi:hypothetical protein PYDG_00030 [Pseudoalteromonas phage pYD6-A]|uniref:Uncharacterized protein n=1 Tax=Pseudoalteromonas phage pYD6-A TaxID=754052 RepID=M4SMG9_9CAUD|nr:hypothetical protein PYDG_00030 [Pseudoalteromonas phage pYD6-A]AGH57562.1 hypothetical protein PYDG_00030 [Pseudoalteromonas phage pYD6-A]
MINEVKNPRFMLCEYICMFSKRTKWLVVSSMDLAATFIDYKDIEYHVRNGSITTSSFGHDSLYTPEYIINHRSVKTSRVKHHGYFKHLKDIVNYLKMEELLK